MFKQSIQVFARAARWPVVSYGPPHFSLTPAIIQRLRVLPYLERWRQSISEQWYHILLEDHSILTFSTGVASASFAYLHCPLDVPTFRNFVMSLDLPFDARTREMLRDDYQEVLDTALLKSNVTPIRYDYDENGYRCGIHPVSHIHVGLDNQIRLGFAKKMTPVSFALFVIRHMYPECWARILDHQEASRLPKAIRLDCQDLSDLTWHEKDQVELYLN